MKVKRIFCGLLAALSVLSIAGCTNGNETTSSNSEVSEEVFEPLAYVQKFDDYMDMYNCGFVNFFGKIDLSEEQAESGTAAKIHIQQVSAYSSNPCLHVDMKRADYGYDYSDLSMIDSIGFYVYNANDFEGSLNFKIAGEDGSLLVNEYYTLKANAGMNVQIKIDRTYMKLNNVPAAKLRFDVNKEDNSIWYFDDIYVKKAYQPIVIADRSFDESNLLDFSQLDDINYIVKDSDWESTTHVVNYKLVADKGIVNDKGALRVDFLRQLDPSGDYTIQPGYYYSGVALGKVFYENFNFTKLWTQDLCVDVYSAMNKTMTFMIRITDGVGTTFDKEYVIAPNTWSTMKFNFNDCGENTTMRLEHISKVSVYVKYQEMDGDKATFYLDNIRLEDIQK